MASMRSTSRNGRAPSSTTQRDQLPAMDAPALPSWYASASLRPTVTSAANRVYATPRTHAAHAGAGGIQLASIPGISTTASATRLSSSANKPVRNTASRLRGSTSAGYLQAHRKIEPSTGGADINGAQHNTMDVERSHSPGSRASPEVAGGPRILLSSSLQLSMGSLAGPTSAQSTASDSAVRLPMLSENHGSRSRAMLPSRRQGPRGSASNNTVLSRSSHENDASDDEQRTSSLAGSHRSILQRAVFGDSRARQVAADVMRTDFNLRTRLAGVGVLSMRTRTSGTHADPARATLPSRTIEHSLEGTDYTGLVDAAAVARALPTASTKERTACVSACASALAELGKSVPVQRSTPQPVLQLLARIQETLAAAATAAERSEDSPGAPLSTRRDELYRSSCRNEAGDHSPTTAKLPPALGTTRIIASSRSLGSESEAPPLHPVDDYDVPSEARVLAQPARDILRGVRLTGPVGEPVADNDVGDDDSMDGFEMWASDAAASKLALGDEPVVVYEKSSGPGTSARAGHAPILTGPGTRAAAGMPPKAPLPKLGLGSGAVAMAAASYQDDFMRQAETWSQSWRDEAGLQPTAIFKQPSTNGNAK